MPRVAPDEPCEQPQGNTQTSIIFLSQQYEREALQLQEGRSRLLPLRAGVMGLHFLRQILSPTHWVRMYGGPVFDICSGQGEQGLAVQGHDGSGEPEGLAHRRGDDEKQGG